MNVKLEFTGTILKEKQLLPANLSKTKFKFLPFIIMQWSNRGTGYGLELPDKYFLRKRNKALK